MRNRALQIKMIKTTDPDSEAIADNEMTFETVAMTISYTIDKLTERIVTGVCAYVVLDTVRQIVVKTISQK